MENGFKRIARLAAAGTIGALLAGTLFVSPAGAARDVTSACPASTPEDNFTDTGAAGSAIESAVDCVRAYNVTSGNTATTYNPSGTVSRGQMATFMVNILRRVNGFNLPQNPPDRFTDDNGTTHEANINIAAQLGIVQGLTATTYGPGNNVTRDQMATFIVNTIKTGGGTLPANGPNAFTDDNGNTHEANINILAEPTVDIVDGLTATTYGPGNPVSRGQMAFFVTRALDLLVDQNRVTPIAGNNQTFSVPQTTETHNVAAPGAQDTTRTCTVTGIPNGTTVDVRMVPTTDLTVAQGGQVSFLDANGNSQYDETATPARIVNVNGTNINPAGVPPGQEEVNDIVAAIGAISVTFIAVAPTDVQLLVWQDNPGFTAQVLDLNVAANNNPKTPRESFGVGCRTIFANEAPSGPVTPGAVTSVSKDNDVFSIGALSYFYDANDVFQLFNGAACVQVTQAVFETAISIGDDLLAAPNQSTYNGDPAFASTFCLQDDSPANPTFTLTGLGTSTRVDIGESATLTNDLYRVYRVIRPPSGTCPDFQTLPAGRAAYTLVGTVSDPTPGATGGAPTFTDTGLTENTFYCYSVTAVDDGSESNGADEQQVNTGTVADAGSPLINDVRAQDNGTVGVLDAGDNIQMIFSEAMATTADDAGQLIRVRDADGTVAEVVCGTNATCALQGAGTFNGSPQAANQVLRITVTGAVTPLTGFLGSNPGVQYPAEVTNASAGFDDVAGNQLNIAGSPDKSIDVATITPAFV